MGCRLLGFDGSEGVYTYIYSGAGGGSNEQFVCVMYVMYVGGYGKSAHAIPLLM